MTRIVATGLSAPDGALGSNAHAVRAGRAALDAAGIGVDDVDLLINVGVYRDDNMCEPAMSAIIQHELGMGLDPRRFATPRTVFSFDLMNGAAGILDAVQVAGISLVQRGLHHALIVASDAHPSQTPRPDFPLSPMGAALVLAPGEGFGPMAFHSALGDTEGQRGFCDLEAWGTAARHEIDVVRDDDFEDQLLAHAIEHARAFLAAHPVDPAPTRLLCSQPTASFASRLGAALGLPPIDVHGTYGDAHSATLPIGHHLAAADGRFAPGDVTLWVAAGGGYTVNCALYRHP